MQLIGRARTGLYMPVYAPPAEGENPYEVEIALVVTDGMVRDVKQIREMRFAVFCGGIGPLDTKGRARMVDRDVPVMCAGVTVRRGDMVFGDVDGVVVIPQEVEREVVRRALEKVSGENQSREGLQRGEKLADVFRRLGIL